METYFVYELLDQAICSIIQRKQFKRFDLALQLTQVKEVPRSIEELVVFRIIFFSL